jgi:hypothetical protein
MREVKDLVSGPFKDENAFKQAVLQVWRKNNAWLKHFEIENEEKAPGMPDVLSISGYFPSFFTELKISDASGVIVFQKTQPLFYKQNKDIKIDILAWDIRFNRVVSLSPDEVIRAKTLKIKLPEEL